MPPEEQAVEKRGEPVLQAAVFLCLRGPFAEADGVPVEDGFAEEGPAEGEDDPVADHGGGLRRGGDVVEGVRAMKDAGADGLEGEAEGAQDFAGAAPADFLDGVGEAGVDVVDFEVAVVAAPQAVEHEAHHGALPVMGRGHMGEDDEFHGALAVRPVGRIAGRRR